ncbi:MAG: hypothetical protein ACYC1I_11970 [Acidimicrobiales bacterium]
MNRHRVLVAVAVIVVSLLQAVPSDASTGTPANLTYTCTPPAVASGSSCVTTTTTTTPATGTAQYTQVPVFNGPPVVVTTNTWGYVTSCVMWDSYMAGQCDKYAQVYQIISTTTATYPSQSGYTEEYTGTTYSCPGGGTLSGSSCVTTTSTPPVPATLTSSTCPTGYVLGTGNNATTCYPDAVTTVVTGTTVTVTLPFDCPSGPHAGDPSYSATYSYVESIASYPSAADATAAATSQVNKEGLAWQGLYCGSFRSVPETATATSTGPNPPAGTVCTATATEASTVSQAAADAAAQAAAQAMANAECGVVTLSAFTATETRSFTGTVAGVNYYGCVNGVLTPETGPSFTGTSPSFTAIAGGATQAQANSNAAAAAVAMGMANVTATVNAEAAALGTAAATTCAGTTTTTTPGASGGTTTTTTPGTSTTTTTTPPTATNTVTKVTNIWLPILAIVNSARAVIVNSHATIRALLIPLTQVAATTPTLETTDPITGVTTPGCTPTENVAPFTSTNPAGSFTMPNCSIVGGVGDSVMFNFESDTGLAVNSNAFTVPTAATNAKAGYTCPSGGQLDASGTSCVASSSSPASHVQTGSTPIYTYEQTGSTPIYGYVETSAQGGYMSDGYACPYGGQLANTYSCYTGYPLPPGATSNGGGGYYATWEGGYYATYNYQQTGSTPTYANVQTGSTPIYGYTCPSGGTLDASGVTCVITSSYSATYSTVSDTTVWRYGVGPNFHPGG